MWGDAKKAAELQQKLDETIRKKNLRHQIDMLEDEKGRLKGENEAAEKKKDKELELLEEELDAKKEAEEQKYEETKKRLEKEQKDIETDYADKLSDAKVHAEAMKLIQDNNMKEILDLLHKYGDQWKVLGKSFGDRMVEGIKTADPLIDQWVAQVMEKVQKVASPEGFKSLIVDQLNKYIRELQDQWKAISPTPSEDPALRAKQDALHATADAVRKIIESLGGSAIPSYDVGGPIGQTGPAVVHAGEYMLTTRNVRDVSTWLSMIESGEIPGSGSGNVDIAEVVHIDNLYVRDENDYRQISAELKSHIDSRLRGLGISSIRR
jgi:hypothetical protein